MLNRNRCFFIAFLIICVVTKSYPWIYTSVIQYMFVVSATSCGAWWMHFPNASLDAPEIVFAEFVSKASQKRSDNSGGSFNYLYAMPTEGGIISRIFLALSILSLKCKLWWHI